MMGELTGPPLYDSHLVHGLPGLVQRDGHPGDKQLLRLRPLLQGVGAHRRPGNGSSAPL